MYVNVAFLRPASSSLTKLSFRLEPHSLLSEDLSGPPSTDCVRQIRVFTPSPSIDDNGLGEPENTAAGPLRKHVGLVIPFPVSSLHPSSCTPMYSYLVPNVYKTAHRPQMNHQNLSII